MLAYIARRIALALPALFGLVVLTFILSRVIPGDPAATLAGDAATPAQIADIRARYGLDRPIMEQAWVHMRQVLSGDLGNSIFSGRPVSEDIARRLPATLELTFVALLLATCLGIPLGLLAALNHNGPIDHLVRVLSVGGLAMASFWLAIMLQLQFSMEWDLLPLRGRMDVPLGLPPRVTGFLLIDSLLAGRGDMFVDAARHLVLPAVTLALPGLATIARFTRSGVLEALQKDYVLYARAAGYGRFRLATIYVLRNAITVTVTQIGLLFGALISGAVAIEAVFDWPGLGTYAVQAILSADYKALLAVTLVVGVIYAAVNVLVDVAQALIDPRVALQ
ncbi:MAG: ABC transporter permease [Rhodospirillales bacterium]|jgi:peptide/nickel transport system permease protein|uniref:ABC transporter permease n=1 Tax=Rhodovarius sp. TaxID=2972673 RepID=UPI001D3A9A37|nr:ABC transporter permease [Alphaproteobacteria bacterium]NDG49087.1 ABC transporter permease [Rhodospirillales bacterium]